MRRLVLLRTNSSQGPRELQSRSEQTHRVNLATSPNVVVSMDPIYLRIFSRRQTESHA
ncbi:hypothetical protein B0G81_3449 [Paraburkholderia sp. BL6665CI2N2]|nr:hypothetical protein B0G81_3449 [Paraburkholderia sp. BL6665CI2N2]